MSTRHVVLLTYGEPPTPDYFAHLRYSWRILLGLTRRVASIPAPLLPLIALSRARLRHRTWTDERYGSPLEEITRAQVGALAVALAAADPSTDWRVHEAYEFRDPLLLRVVGDIPAGEPVDVVPLYAADSAFTHTLSRDTLEAWGRGRPPRPAPVRVLPPLPEQALVELSVRHVRRELAARNVRPGRDWALLLAAHGTLLEPPRPYETGRLATERLCAGIASRLASEFGHVTNGWLNHTYGGRWTEPPADRALRALADHGFRKVVYYPYGFLADNAETELEGRQVLRTQPALESVHLRCLNADAELAAVIARQVAGVPPAGAAPAPAAHEEAAVAGA